MGKIMMLTTIAMLAFATNSVLARLALVGGDMDALGYSGVRLISGAAVLGALVLARRLEGQGYPTALGGSWRGAAALFGYALAFSIAYLMLGAGTGALILFATVQMSILGWAIAKGERPGLLEAAGIGVAFIGLVYLVSPGLVAPNPMGAALMAGAGICWAAYTLLGRGSISPLVDTAGNFIRCLPLAAILAVVGVATHGATWRGAAYAIASGAIASGLGYAIWYAVLPHLSRIRAAFVQLTVPAIAAAGGALLIGESLTLRLVVATMAILGGVALALQAAQWRRASQGAG